MNIFSTMRLPNPWTMQNVRFLDKCEKDIIRCAIVVKSNIWYSLEFHTRRGIKYIPLSAKVSPSIGFVPDIDKIKIITLVNDDQIIYRVEF